MGSRCSRAIMEFRFTLRRRARRSISRSPAAPKFRWKNVRPRKSLHSPAPARRRPMQSSTIPRSTLPRTTSFRPSSRSTVFFGRPTANRFPISSCVRRMKFYDFIDKAPSIGKLVIIEGTERVLAERALEVLLDRLLPPDVRDLNLARFSADEAAEAPRVAEALQAMPFLADRRVVVASDTQTMRVAARRELWEVAQNVPEGSTLVLIDLLPTRGKGPQSFGVTAGRAALRIDTTAGEEARARFVDETLAELNAKADARVVEELARSGADLAAVRNDLEKLALGGKKITLKDFEREALSIEDPKAYKYA